MATQDRAADPPEQSVAGAARPSSSSVVAVKDVWDWIDDRLGLSAFRYRVPVHANTIWYTLGGVTFVGIFVLFVTGIWLAQYYNPDPASARQSVLYIQDTAGFGDVIRGIHVWTAYLVVITSVLHLGRIFVTASYKRPRELNWLVGLALLGLVLFGALFTGTVLRWDQEAYEALEHNTEAAQILGTLGGFFASKFTTSVALLPRLYIAHVSIVPGLIVLLLTAHLFLIKHHGISPTPAQTEQGEAPGGRLRPELETGSYATHLRKMVGFGFALVGLAATFGVLFIPKIGAAPDPTMEVTKPPLFFYWLYAFEDWFGVSGIFYAAVVFFGLLALLPFVDRTPLRRVTKRPIVTAFGVVVLLIIIALSIKVAIQPAARHLG